MKTQSAGTSLVVTPHPVLLQEQRVYHGEMAQLVPGEYLITFLARYEVVPGQQWVVAIGGVDVPEAYWGRIKPRHGHLIEARRVPQGEVLKLVATVALAYFTFGAGGMAGGAFFGLTGATGYLAAGVAFLGGSMLINKLLGPKPVAAKQAPALATNTSSPTYSLQAGKNRARQFETMGLVLGQPYIVPDLAAQPYTFFANGEQYLWQLFHFGINCATVDTLRIGQTAIENYSAVTVHREGFDTGNTGLPNLSTNVDTVTGALLEAPGGPGPQVTRTSSSQTIVLGVDLELQLYSVEPTTGAQQANAVAIRLEYRAVGAPGWQAFAEGGADIRLVNASSKPLRLTYQRTVLAGQYDVRLQKLTADDTVQGFSNVVQWQLLKSFQIDNGDYKGQSRLAVQIQATGQLNGTLDEVNARGTAKPMPFWNGGAWVTATHRENGLSNPGALMLLLYRGIYDVDGRLIAGMGADDDEIDIEGLKLFMEHCTAHGFTFDLFLQENTSIGDLIESIAAAGLGSRSEHTGKLGVIWFSDDQPVEGVLNMATMKPKTFSVEYNTGETADEIEFQYFDRDRGNTWKSVRVKAPDVGTPNRTARQQLQGVTTEGHAAVLARFSMAQNFFQRKTVNNEVDLEHMTFRRGTVMALSHDLTQWGYGGRLQAAVNNAGLLTLDLDDVIPAVSPTGAVTRYLGLRLAGERQYRIFPIAAFVGTTKTVTLATVWPGGVAVPGDASDNPAHDTIWIYDFKPTPGQKLRVSDIAPKSNLEGASVQLVPESPEFWNYVWYGSYTPPSSGSLLQRGVPVVTRALVTEQLARQGNTFYVELTCTYEVTGNFDRAELWGAVDGGALQRIGIARTQALSWRGGLSETWTLELRPYSATRAGAAFKFQYTVIGLAFNPEKPEGLALTQKSVYCKPTQYAVDVVGFVVRSTPGVVQATMADFLRGSKCHEGLVSGFPWDFPSRLYGVQTVMVVSEDSSGKWSEVAYDSLDFGQPSNDNIGQTANYRALGWPGTHPDCSVVAGDLVSDIDPGSDLNLLQDWNGEPDLNATQLLTLVYETLAFVPLYGGGTMVLDVDTEGPQRAVEYRVSGSTVNDLNSLADWNTEADLNGVSGGWQPWPGALTVTRGIGYALRVTIAGGTEQPKVKTLTVKLALQRVTQTFPAMAISAGGTRLAPGAGTPAVTWVTVQTVTMLPEVDGSGAVAGRFLDLSPTLGPLVQQVNSIGVAVASRSLPTVGGLIDA
ncbi:MAG: phage tail protein [Pseudomonadota bacterium]